MIKEDESRGFSLWCPEPDGRLPADYASGVKFGDLGIVTEIGGFDILFNICLPANHPIHRTHGVPPGFRQVILNDDNVRFIPSWDDKEEILVTQSVTTNNATLSSSLSGDPTAITSTGAALRYEFNSSSSEGAVLVLPEGTSKADIINATEFKELAQENAAAWYHFAYSHLGRTSISNDSLYLITGYDKSSSWAVSSFSGAVEGTALSFSLTATPVVNGGCRCGIFLVQGPGNLCQISFRSEPWI
ncbi:hypothetical protein BU15DRAFT_57042 [Melanogaster broomeanus]|nr:hypothetical protein BU15DRAFT_57042 [Melanogaster broomeanus]